MGIGNGSPRHAGVRGTGAKILALGGGECACRMNARFSPTSWYLRRGHSRKGGTSVVRPPEGPGETGITFRDVPTLRVKRMPNEIRHRDTSPFFPHSTVFVRNCGPLKFLPAGVWSLHFERGGTTLGTELKEVVPDLRRQTLLLLHAYTD